MTPIEKAEQMAALAKEYKSIEFALHLVDRALHHDAHILAVKAEDDALSERSIELTLTKKESAEVFTALQLELQSRLKAIEEKLK